ncbi:MAG: PCMD domain-containing protein [Draconibacterium sp.]|nr:PCMD domain-containing protein [Draconibacterium sp.]
MLIAGTLFLGEMIEPVRNMKDPIKKVNQGVPFNQTPKAIKFDYKYTVGTSGLKQRIAQNLLKE